MAEPAADQEEEEAEGGEEEEIRRYQPDGEVSEIPCANAAFSEIMAVLSDSPFVPHGGCVNILEEVEPACLGMLLAQLLPDHWFEVAVNKDEEQDALAAMPWIDVHAFVSRQELALVLLDCGAALAGRRGAIRFPPQVCFVQLVGFRVVLGGVGV